MNNSVFYHWCFVKESSLCRHGLCLYHPWYKRFWYFFWNAKEAFDHQTCTAYCSFCREYITIPVSVLNCYLLSRFLAPLVFFAFVLPVMIEMIPDRSLPVVSGLQFTPEIFWHLTLALAGGVIVGLVLVPKIIIALSLTFSSWRTVDLMGEDRNRFVERQKKAVEHFRVKARFVTAIALSCVASILRLMG